MDNLLARSQVFEEALIAVFAADSDRILDDSPRQLVTLHASMLSIEHASAVRHSFALGTPNSGAALLRLQYESLLRGAWALHAATDLQISKLTSQLDSDGEQTAKNLPGGLQMLEALESKAPAGLVQPLKEFQVYSWKALNSYVHSGIHPLRRVSEGFPKELGAQTVRQSNGLMHFSYRLVASLGGSPELMHRVTRAYVDFQDCLPMA